MKFLLVHFIVVPLIIFPVPLPKGTIVDDAPDKNCGNSTGEWTRVAYINVNISDPQNSCSKKLTYTFARACPGENCPKVHFCTRSRTKPQFNGCSSIKFSTFGISYNKVCGRARGYQYGFTCAFHSYEYAGQRTLDDSYVSGLSVTHDRPGKREHIWTFAAGFSKAYGYATVNCPDALYPGPHPPKFVGDNYFCNPGNLNNSKYKWHVENDNRLWTPQGSEDAKWFTRNVALVDEKHSKYIEVRICRWPPYTRIEDIGVDQLEIYITEDKKKV